LKFPFHRIAPALIFLMVVILDGMKKTRYNAKNYYILSLFSWQV
jgi:hypothetical protein